MKLKPEQKSPSYRKYREKVFAWARSIIHWRLFDFLPRIAQCRGKGRDLLLSKILPALGPTLSFKTTTKSVGQGSNLISAERATHPEVDTRCGPAAVERRILAYGQIINSWFMMKCNYSQKLTAVRSRSFLYAAPSDAVYIAMDGKDGGAK